MVFFVEDGRIFASLFAIVAAYAYVVVVVEVCAHVDKLLVQHLLRAKHVGGFKVYLVAQHLAACGPYVAVAVVATVVVTNVVRAYK